MDTDTLLPILAGLIRHALTTLGGILVTDGYLQSSDVAGFVGGGMIVVGIIWSWWQKKGQQEALAILRRARPTAVKSIVACLMIGFAFSYAFPAHAAAQTSSSLAPTAVAQKIQQLAAPDVAYAIQLAKAVNTPQGNVRAQCYQAIQNAIPVAPAGSAMPPEPHLVTNVEQLAEVIDALQPNGPLLVNCGGAAQLVQQNVLSFINAVVTGFLGATKAIPLLAVAP